MYVYIYIYIDREKVIYGSSKQFIGMREAELNAADRQGTCRNRQILLL